MTMLDALQSLTGGPLGWAGFVGALGFAIKQASTAMAKRSEAKSKRIVAEAEAEKARAEAKAAVDLETARAERAEVEEDVMRETNLAALLDEIRVLRERLDAQAVEIDELRRAMRKAGIPTPPRGFAAARRDETPLSAAKEK